MRSDQTKILFDQKLIFFVYDYTHCLVLIMSKSAEYDLILRIQRLEKIIRNGDYISILQKQLRELQIALHLLDIVPTKEEHHALKVKAQNLINKTEGIIAEKKVEDKN